MCSSYLVVAMDLRKEEEEEEEEEEEFHDALFEVPWLLLVFKTKWKG